MRKLRTFTGDGPAPSKLNEMVSLLNRVLNLKGDDTIRVVWTPSGPTVTLDYATLEARIAKHGKAGTTEAGTQLTFYEVAQTPNMVTLSDYYKLRQVNTVSWALATAYLADAIVVHNSKTYKCIFGHTSTADDEPDTGVNRATYWVEFYLNGYIFAPPFSGKIQEYAPLLVVGEKVLTILDDADPTKIWIVSPGFMHIALTSGSAIVQKSLWWNTSERRLMSTFGGD